MSDAVKESRIFLSYHSSKVELVTHLAKYLEKSSIITWYAERDIRPGQVWDEAIHAAIRDCKAVVLLFCAQADSSIQVKRELSLADKYKNLYSGCESNGWNRIISAIFSPLPSGSIG